MEVILVCVKSCIDVSGTTRKMQCIKCVCVRVCVCVCVRDGTIQAPRVSMHHVKSITIQQYIYHCLEALAYMIIS